MNKRRSWFGRVVDAIGDAIMFVLLLEWLDL